MVKEYKLDIKDVLSAIDRNDFSFFSKLTDDERKAFSAWTIMRFVSSSNRYSEHYLMMVNSFVNENFSDLSAHPELQWKLLCLCGAGSKQFHPWIPPPRKKGKNKTQEFLSTIYPFSNSDELALLQSTYSKDELIELAMSTGLSKKEAKQKI